MKTLWERGTIFEKVKKIHFPLSTFYTPWIWANYTQTWERGSLFQWGQTPGGENENAKLQDENVKVKPESAKRKRLIALGTIQFCKA